MSRNLCTTSCTHCGSNEILLEEAPRPICILDAGAYYDEFEGMLVANARCALCLALYLAWVDETTRKYPPMWWGSHMARKAVESIDWRPKWRPFDVRDNLVVGTHVDLSWRSSFNDEPGIRDLPLYVCVEGQRARLVDERDFDTWPWTYFSHRMNDERDRPEQQAWWDRWASEADRRT